MKNTSASSMANTANATMLPAAKAGSRNSRSGTIGLATRSSQPTNTAVSSTPPTSVPMISALPQPAPFARISAQTMPNTPAVPSTRPTGSRPTAAPAPAPAGILIRISGSMTTPIGMLSQKIHCQARPWVIAPPTTGPRPTAIPVTLLKMPIAQPLRSGGKAADSSASASGSITAAPAPCTALAAISTPALGDSAHAADAAVKIATPTASIARLPSRSPSAAPVSSSTAKLSVYAFTVHSSAASEACKCTLITGSAVATTWMSSDTISDVIEVSASTQPCADVTFREDASTCLFLLRVSPQGRTPADPRGVPAGVPMPL